MKAYCIYKGETYLGVGLLISNSESGNCFTNIVYIQNRLIKLDNYVTEWINEEGMPQCDVTTEEHILAEYINCAEWDALIEATEPSGNITF